METQIQEMITKARKAQKELEHFTQGQVDAVVREIAFTVNRNAEMLAEMAVKETKMGNIKDKTIKNKMKSELIWAHLKDIKTVGILRKDEEKGIIEIGEPVGVVAAIIPCTGPVVTAMSNSMFAIKSRNSIIVAPHPRAKNVTVKTVEMIIEAARKTGLPENAIQVIREPSKELSHELMRSADVVIATGGPAMVKAAYSSGRPSYGVGPGNTPAVIHNTADIKEAVSDIIKSKIYDNGLICSSEQSVIVTKDIADSVLREFRSQGSHIVVGDEKNKLQSILIKDGGINPEIIGQDAQAIAKLAGIKLPQGEEIKVLLVPDKGVGREYPFSREKMSPILSIYTTDTFEDSVKLAVELLRFEGSGHTASIHTKDDESIMAFALAMKTSRVLVNQPSAQNGGGSRVNNLVPTTTLGCGTWGGNALTDNITAMNLLNIKRVAFKLEKPRDTSKVFSGS